MEWSSGFVLSQAFGIAHPSDDAACNSVETCFRLCPSVHYVASVTRSRKFVGRQQIVGGHATVAADASFFLVPKVNREADRSGLSLRRT